MLYLAWKLDPNNVDAAELAQQQLAAGEASNLYRLQSYTVSNEEASALLLPRATLEQIAEAVWGETAEPVASRWVLSDG